jgi:hypothetical protein
MFRGKFILILARICGVSAALMLALCACNLPKNEANKVQAGNGATDPAPAIIRTVPGAAPTAVESGQLVKVTMYMNGAAAAFTSQVVAAVPASAGGPYWEVMPQYQLLTLTDYAISKHLMKAQIFIYPAGELAPANEGAGQIATDLQTLLQNQQAGRNMPFLPLFNATQVMHAQVKYLDFKNGKGVRYLTQFNQGVMPINNHELIYTFQGLSRDSKYYVAAVLPVNLTGLPADEKVNVADSPEMGSHFPKYVEDVVNKLNQQSADAFNPGLDKLDRMIQSMEIKQGR